MQRSLPSRFCGLSDLHTTGYRAVRMFTSVAERVRSAIVPHKRDTATLEESLGQLRSFVDEIAKREKFVNDSLQLLNERLKSYQRIGGALDVALTGDDINAVRAALDELDAKPDHSELLREPVKSLSRACVTRVPLDTFLSEHREARLVLKTACEHRLKEARATLEKATVEEQRRLNSLGEGYDASTSPVVKRASAHVAQVEGMLGNIESASAEGLQTFFVNYAQQLLNHE